MIETVLFDLFGVIARHQSAEGKERLVRTAEVPAAPFWDAYWEARPPYDRGAVDGPEYWRQVAARLGTRFDDQRTARLLQADLASWDEVDSTMVALVEEWAADGRDIALLSNIPPELADHYEERHPWLGRFRLRAFSCRIGHVKPEPDAYRWCQGALGVPADRMLFVDDRAVNVAGAESTGMRGHVFTTPDHLRNALAGWDATPDGA